MIDSASEDGVHLTSEIAACALWTPLADSPAANWQKMAVDGAVLRRSEFISGVADAIRDRFPHSHELVELDRVIQIALLAATDALAKTHRPRLTDADGLFVATSKGPILTLLAAQQQPLLMRESAAAQIALGPAAIGYYLQKYFGTAGSAHTCVAACAGSLAAVHRACHALGTGRHERVIIVAADSSIHPLFDSSFSRLGILAPRDDSGRSECRPFDPAGNGFYITEAAAAVVLVKHRNGRVVIDGTWLGADATGLLATDPSAKSLRRGIKALSSDTRIDFVHAHATGTRHDAHELSAIQIARPQYVFSHKRFIGHSLGASGLVGLVLSAMCHERQMTLLGDPLPRDSASLTLAQGFGGHIGAVRLRSRE